MRRGERVQLTQLGPEPSASGRRGTGQERLCRSAEAAELFLRRSSRADRPPGVGSGAAAVLVSRGGLSGGDGTVVGDHRTGVGVHDQYRPDPVRTSTLVPIRAMGTE